MPRLALFFALSIFALSPFAFADIPHLISLQGKLTNPDGNAITDTQTNLTFRIYNDASAGNVLWSESQYPIALDANGVFSVLLGSVRTLSIPFNESYWLSVEIRAGAGPSEVLSPRQQMGSASYALRSESPWNTTGNNIYTTNAGNVGIGTASPQYPLHLKGTAEILSVEASSGAGEIKLAGVTDQDAGLVFYEAATPRWYLMQKGSSGSNEFALYDQSSAKIFTVENAGAANTLYLKSNGNVGIGTTNPGAKLQVNGAIWAGTDGYPANGNQGVELSSGADDNFWIRTYTNTPNPNFAIGVGNGAGGWANQPIFWNGFLALQKDGGNVGVGLVPTGAAKLEVAGNVKIADGTQGAGKVLTSDANGLASWQDNSVKKRTFPDPLLNQWNNEQYIDDGNIGTSASTSHAVYDTKILSYDFGTDKLFGVSAETYMYNGGAAGSLTLYIEASHDNTNWFTLASTGIGTGSKSDNVVVPATVARYMRFREVANYVGPSSTSINEAALYY